MTETLEVSPAGRAARYAREVPQGCAIDAMGIRPTWAAAGTARAEMVVEDRRRRPADDLIPHVRRRHDQ